ncbi:MAG: NAD-dependent epimerase/dehydratase family protein, partial [Stellaceae bacterium]
LSGPLEPTNQWYAIAKIAGLKLAEACRRQWNADFISAQPTNLYGPGDTYDERASHVIPALLLKTHRAKLARASEVEIWGSGRPRREFLHVDDLAEALIYLMERYSDALHVNIGCGSDVSIAELAALVARTVGFTGRFRYAAEMPDGAPQKLLDVGRISALGWRPRIGLDAGLADAYRWFVENVAAAVA